MICDNVAKVRERIALACKKVGRDPQEITLIGVTKFAPLSAINEAVAAGIEHIAENRVQEAQNKFPLVVPSARKLTKHLIGHLQTNKVKDVLKVVDLIQSVDSIKLAEEIERQAAKNGKVFEVLLQVNTAREEQKYGAAPEDIESIIEAILPLAHIKVMGLMAMAPFTDELSRVANSFQDLRKINERLQHEFSGQANVQLKYLSMGMSSDFEIAIAEGSNMVRIGTAIFKE